MFFGMTFALSIHDTNKEQAMGEIREDGVENEVKGKGNDLKGRVKDAVGGLTGDGSLQAEGKMDRAKGKIQEKVGEAQQKIDRDDKI